MKFLNIFEHIVTILWCLQFVPELYKNFTNKLSFSYHFEGQKIYLNFHFPRKFYIKNFYHDQNIVNTIFDFNSSKQTTNKKLKYLKHYCLELDKYGFVENLKIISSKKNNSTVKFYLDFIDVNSKSLKKSFKINLKKNY